MKKFAILVSAVAFAGAVGCVHEGPHYRNVRYYGDAQISAAVESNLDSHGLQSIEVSTSDGTVYLDGRVRDAGLRDYAGRLASRTRGVTRVVNNIDVVRRTRAGDAPESWEQNRGGGHFHPYGPDGH